MCAFPHGRARHAVAHASLARALPCGSAAVPLKAHQQPNTTQRLGNKAANPNFANVHLTLGQAVLRASAQADA